MVTWYYVLNEEFITIEGEPIKKAYMRAVK